MALAPTDDIPTLRIHYETDGLLPAADVAAMLREVAAAFDRFAKRRRRYADLRLAVRRVAVSSLDADLVVMGVGAATAALEHRQALYDFVGFITNTLSIAKGLMPGKVKAADAKMIDAVQKPVAEAEAQQVNRRFAVDLDPFKRHSGASQPAAAEFDSLFDPSEGHRAYYEEIASVENATPTLQIGTDMNVPDRLMRARELDRGLVLRLQHGVTAAPIALARQVIHAIEDLAIFIDLGWSDDLLSRELWASNILEAVSEDVAEREIVVAGSSFPDAFRSVARDEIRADERIIFDNLVQRHNAVVLTYGDWGSTRLPKEPIPMGSIPPRIDLPNSREWVAFRKDGEESFQDIAIRAIKDPAWPRDLQIWGTYQIAATAEGVPDAIKGQTKAAAARVNIHLHQQAHFGAPGNFSDRDELFTDDL